MKTKIVVMSVVAAAGLLLLVAACEPPIDPAPAPGPSTGPGYAESSHTTGIGLNDVSSVSYTGVNVVSTKDEAIGAVINLLQVTAAIPAQTLSASSSASAVSASSRGLTSGATFPAGFTQTGLDEFALNGFIGNPSFSYSRSYSSGSLSVTTEATGSVNVTHNLPLISTAQNINSEPSGDIKYPQFIRDMIDQHAVNISNMDIDANVQVGAKTTITGVSNSYFVNGKVVSGVDATIDLDVVDGAFAYSPTAPIVNSVLDRFSGIGGTVHPRIAFTVKMAGVLSGSGSSSYGGSGKVVVSANYIIDTGSVNASEIFNVLSGGQGSQALIDYISTKVSPSQIHIIVKVYDNSNNEVYSIDLTGDDIIDFAGL